MTRQVSDQLYIELEYYYPEDYYVYIAEAQSSQASNFSITADFTVIKQADSAISSSATVDSTIDIFRNVTADLTVEASQSSDAVKTASASMITLSLFTPNFIANVSVDPGADLNSVISISTIANKIAVSEITASAVFNVGCDAVKTIFADSLVASIATVASTAQRLRDIEAAAIAAFSLAVTEQRFRDFPAAISSTSTVSAAVSVIRSAQSSSTSESTVTAAAARIRAVDSSLGAVVTVSVDYIRQRPFDAQLSATATLSATISKSTGYSAALQSTATINADNLRVRYFDSSLNTTATVVCDAIRPEFFSASLSSAFTIQLIKTYWINKIDIPSAGNSQALAVDGTGNVYYACVDSPTPTNYYLIKFNRAGSIVWQKNTEAITDIVLDSSNVYAINTTSITKISDTGNFVWKKILPSGTIHAIQQLGNNIWIAHNTNKITKINPDGTMNSYEFTQSSGTNQAFCSLTTTASSIIFAISYDNVANRFTDIYTIPNTYPSSGTVSVARLSINKTAVYSQPTRIWRDSQNSFLITYTAASNAAIIQKITSTGSKVWARIPTLTTGYAQILYDTYLNRDDRLSLLYTRQISGINRSEVLYINGAGQIERQFRLQTDPYTTAHGSRDVYTNAAIDYYVTGQDKGDGYLAWVPPDEGYGTHQPNSWEYQPITLASPLPLTDNLGTVTFPEFSFDSINQTFNAGTDVLSNSSLTTSFTPIIVNGFDVLENAAQIFSEFAINVTTSNVITFSANLAAVGSKLTVAVKTGRILLDVTATTQLTATARVTADRTVALSATATVICNAVKTTEIQQSLNSESTVTANADRIRLVSANLSAEHNLSAAADRTRSTTANLSSVLQFTITAFVNIQGEIVAQSQFNIVASAIKTAQGSAQLAAQASMVVQGVRTREFTINLSAFNTVVTVGTKLILDPYYQLKVPADTRTWKVVLEDRLLVVDSENRVNTVHAEDFTLTVPRETRVWHIPYSKQVGARRVK